MTDPHEEPSEPTTLAADNPTAPTPAKQSAPGGMPVLVVGRPELVSTSEPAKMTTPDDGRIGNTGSAAAQRAMAAGAPAISSDGRYIAFVSESGELTMGDNNGAADVFLRDLVENTTILISRSLSGTSGAGSSLQPAISADGRFVAFTSSAHDLVEADSNDSLDVFVHDTRTGVITMVSRGINGELANNDSFSPSLSADGRFVAFSSLATNLHPDDTNTSPDVYMHDRVSGMTNLVSVGASGKTGNGPSGQPSVSANGRFVAFTSAVPLADEDTNDVTDVYVHDMHTGANELISKSSDGDAGNAPSHAPSLSADGKAVAFTSEADNLVQGDGNGVSDVFVHDRSDKSTRMVSATPDGQPGDDASHSPAISGDGRRVAYLSAASNLAAGPSEGPARDVEDFGTPPHDRAFVRDLSGAGTALVNSTEEREPGDGESTAITISSWGRHVAFADSSTDLSGQDVHDGEPHVYASKLRTAHLPAPGPSAAPKPEADEADQV